APVRSIVQPIVKGLGDLQPVLLETGEFYDFEKVVMDLASAAYSRVDMVSRRGEFAVRGGILDVFLLTSDLTSHVVFFGFVDCVYYTCTSAHIKYNANRRIGNSTQCLCSAMS